VIDIGVLLVAEDISINQEIVAALLEHTGIDIDFANNGVEAHHMFAKHPERYQLIFMDIQMPQMDGTRPRAPSAKWTFPRPRQSPSLR